MSNRNRNYRVLLADDDLTSLRLEQLLLEGQGYQVIPVNNGEDALRALDEHNPDLVLLDIGMPNLDGFTICQRMRASSQVPIVIVTGRDSSADKVWGLKSGADDYITKPFDPDEFFARLDAVLRRPNLPLVAARSERLRVTLDSPPRVRTLGDWLRSARRGVARLGRSESVARTSQYGRRAWVSVAQSRAYRASEARLRLVWRRFEASRAYQGTRQSTRRGWERLLLRLRQETGPAGRQRRREQLRVSWGWVRQQAALAMTAAGVRLRRLYAHSRRRAAPLMDRVSNRLGVSPQSLPLEELARPAVAPLDPVESWIRTLEFHPELFSMALLQAYLKVLDGVEDQPLTTSPVVPLSELYAVLAPDPERGIFYLKEEFTRDVYLLHRGGHNITPNGLLISFPISRGVRGKNLTINDENGTQLRYYGVRFSRPMSIDVESLESFDSPGLQSASAGNGEAPEPIAVAGGTVVPEGWADSAETARTQVRAPDAAA